MIFQWYLFVIIAAVGLFAYGCGQRHIVNSFGQKELRYGWAPVLVIMAILIYLAGTRGSLNLSWGDTSVYENSLYNLPSSMSGLRDYITDDTKDKGFTVFSTFLKTFIGNNTVLYLSIIAAISLICVCVVYKKYSCSFIITIFLFVASGDYLQWNYNGIRQFLAVAVVFACTGLILKKKYIPAIIIILLMSTIHASALIMLPMIFMVQGKPWNRKTVLLVIGMVAAIAFLDQFTDLITNIMENTQYSSEVSQFEESEGTNALRVVVYSVPAVVSLIFRKRIVQADNKLISLCTNMSVACMAVYVISAFTSGLFLGRLAIYFSLYNYILLPWEIENIFEKRSARAIRIVMILLYLVFYYYQVVITWGL